MKGMFKFYEVGGHVRDSIMGIRSKDIDYVVVPDLDKFAMDTSIKDVFQILVEDLKLRGFEIFLITPQCYTIRAKMPASAVTADFVLARKEIGYKEGTREPISVAGSLFDDLSRRDFTVNAIAKDCRTGQYIDPFDGIQDIKKKVLKTPIRGEITFNDDPLRLLRAMRFAITKDFEISPAIRGFMLYFDYENKFNVVSEERIREEIYKCFRHSTSTTLLYLQNYSALSSYIFTKTNIWLKPTTTEK